MHLFSWLERPRDLTRNDSVAECRFWRCVDIYDRDLTSTSTRLFKGISSRSLKHSMEAAFSAQFGLIVYIYTWEDTHWSLRVFQQTEYRPERAHLVRRNLSTSAKWRIVSKTPFDGSKNFNLHQCSGTMEIFGQRKESQQQDGESQAHIRQTCLWETRLGDLRKWPASVAGHAQTVIVLHHSSIVSNTTTHRCHWKVSCLSLSVDPMDSSNPNIVHVSKSRPWINSCLWAWHPTTSNVVNPWIQCSVLMMSFSTIWTLVMMLIVG